MNFSVEIKKIIFLLILYQIIETFQLNKQSTKYITNNENVNKTGVRINTITNYLLRTHLYKVLC